MELPGYEEAVAKDDLAVDESFWAGDRGSEATDTNSPSRVVSGDEVVFRWELTRQECVPVIADNHPEIEDPEGFFAEYQDEIIHRFQKGFDALVGECGATYETVMSDAIDEAAGEWRDLRRVESTDRQGTTTARGDSGEDGPLLSPSCSNTCKEVMRRWIPKHNKG